MILRLIIGRKESLLELEKRVWDGDMEFYQNHLAEGAVMVFPVATGILERSEILQLLGGGDPWRSTKLRDERLVEVNDGVAQLIYEASPERTKDGSEYEVLITSTYVQENGSLRTVSLQQTPVPG